jgi:hypothetical protein
MRKDQIKTARGKYVLLDFDNSRAGDVSIVMEHEDENGQSTTNLKKIGLVATIKYKEDGSNSIDFTAASASRMGLAQGIIYDRDTLGFEQEMEMFGAMKEIFDKNQDIKRLLRLRAGSDYGMITTLPENIRIRMFGRFLDEEQNPEEKIENLTDRVKEDLKAYETPTDVYERILGAIDKGMFLRYVEKEAETKIRSAITKTSLVIDQLRRKYGVEIIGTAVSGATEALIARATDPKGESESKVYDKIATPAGRAAVEFVVKEVEGSGFVDKAISLIADISSKGATSGYMKTLTEEYADSWKEIFGKRPKTATIPIFDPQAGSGEGILRAMDKRGFNGHLHGTELREIDSDDPRYGVMTGVNSSLFSEVYTSVFSSAKYSKAADNLISYLNPPYTSNDDVAKETVLSYRNEMLITGLFPTKMENFLMKNLSDTSLIVEIPKKLTGYTDPKTPSRFLLVLGTRFDPNATVEKDNLFTAEQAKRSAGAKKISMRDDAEPELLEKILLTHIKQAPMLAQRLYDVWDYYANGENRRDYIATGIYNGIEEKRGMLQRREKILEAAKDALPVVLGKMMPTEVAKRQKIFLDLRFYSEEGIYEKFNFQEVSRNIPLLTYYRDNLPSIFGLIEKVAEELGVDLPVDGSAKSEIFHIGEKPTGKKEKVTNLALGMMRLHYYPTRISLETKEEKDRLVGLLYTIDGIDMSQEGVERLGRALEHASGIVIKNTKIVDPETQLVMPQETFVLIDDYGFDIGTLNIELDQLYKALEDNDYFSIEDYVELAILPTEKKELLMRRFLDDMRSTIETIAKGTGADPRELRNEILKEGKRLALLKTKGMIDDATVSSTIIEFGKKHGLRDLFRGIYKESQHEVGKEIKAAAQAFEIPRKAANKIAEIAIENFNDNPVYFFEDMMDEYFEAVEDAIKDKYYDNHALFEEHMEKFKTGVVEATLPEYQIWLSTSKAYGRMSEVLLRRYAIMSHFLEGKDVSPEQIDKLYATAFRPMFTKTLSLMEHQYNEAERYLAIEDTKRLENMAWQMRSGKSLAFSATSYLLALYKNTDINIVLETANIPDISRQIYEALPFLALNARYYIDPGKMEINPKYIFGMLPTTEAFPNIYKLVPQKKFLGGGKMTGKLVERIGIDIEKNIEALEKRFGENMGKEAIDELAKEYADSPFAKILTSMCQE